MNGSATLFRANIIKRGTNDLVDNFDYRNYPTDGGNVQKLETQGGSARLKWELDGLTLHSILATKKPASLAGVTLTVGLVLHPPHSLASFRSPLKRLTGCQITTNSRKNSGLNRTPRASCKDRWFLLLREDLKVDSFNYDTLNNNRQQAMRCKPRAARHGRCLVRPTMR